ncbi:hypothetical protein [Micromonospora sp. NPDC023888]|uniref:hypothetical protein n=1 Tax=Micromonospora sp. NPDC023888 TaxID=3155607 RepID=UPI00340C4880
MPPRRHPRSWLAGRLRSAAGAVQRLAGRVEPAGAPARSDPPKAAPPTLGTPTVGAPALGAPAVAPRRFGEPPQHWLDLVAAHAPGLLHDLDVGRPAAATTEGRDDPADGSGFDDRIDQDGPDRWTELTRPTRPAGEGAGLPADPVDRRAPGTVGHRAPGTVGHRAPGTVGRRAPGTVGRRAPGTDGRSGHATSMSGPDAAAHSSGSGRPASATPGTVGGDGTVDAAYGVDGPEAVSGVGRPDGSRSTGATGESTHASRAADRSGGPEMDGASPRVGSDASDGAVTAEVPRAPDADRRPPGRLRDGWRQRVPSRRVAATEPAPVDTPATDPKEQPRVGNPTRPAAPPLRTHPAEILEDFGPSRGTFLPRSTTDSAGGGGAAGGGAAGGGGLWPALPDELARSGQQVGERVGQHTAPRNGAAARAAGVGWIGSVHREPGGGRGPENTGSQADATAFDRWPALPDDTALWSVAGAALDTAQLGRLDREQAGG